MTHEHAPQALIKPNRWFRAAVMGLGLATAYLLWVLGPAIKPGHMAIYHWNGQPRDLFLPIALDFLIGWMLLTLLLRAVDAPGRLRRVVWAGILLFTPSITLKSWALLSGTNPHLLSKILFAWAIGGALVLVVFWRPGWAGPLERTVEAATALLALVALSGVVFLGQLGWNAWQARSLGEPPPLHQEEMASRGEVPKPRVVWVVFDELSFQQVYERRFPGLQMPAFDALAAQAAVFTRVMPGGKRTDRIFPSLLTGKPVDEIRSSAAGKLAVHDPYARTWAPFDPHDTVFQDALNNGYRTAVVGWFNPYCRLLPAVLDRCFWKADFEEENGMVAGGSVRTNMLQPLLFLLGTGDLYRHVSRWLPVTSDRVADARLHIEDLRVLTRMSDQALRDPSENFVLLHLPIPHPGGIYDRTKGQLTTGPSSYIDNLALADKCLARIRSILEGTGQWDSSTLVVMGDHGWRTSILWKGTREWTAEDDVASRDGQFDQRPAYIVKLAGETTGTRIDAEFPAVDTRKLLDGLLTQKITSTDELAAWAQQPH